MTDNQYILEKANAAVAKGDYETFLSFCTEDTQWNFKGDRVLHGKDAVRSYMAQVYIEPPKFKVDHLIAEADYVVAQGEICLKRKDGNWVSYVYCDVWTFKEGKMHELDAYVIEIQEKNDRTDLESETVIGSGYTYDEAKEPTDESRPVDEVNDQDIVELPDLGKPNRP